MLKTDLQTIILDLRSDTFSDEKHSEDLIIREKMQYSET